MLRDTWYGDSPCDAGGWRKRLLHFRHDLIIEQTRCSVMRESWRRPMFPRSRELQHEDITGPKVKDQMKKCASWMNQNDATVGSNFRDNKTKQNKGKTWVCKASSNWRSDTENYRLEWSGWFSLSICTYSKVSSTWSNHGGEMKES